MKTFLILIAVSLLGMPEAEADQDRGIELKHHNYSPDPRLLVQRVLGSFVVDVDLGEAFKAQNTESVILTFIVKTPNGEVTTSKSYKRDDAHSEPIVFDVPEEDFGLITLTLSIGFGFSGDIASFKLSELYPARKTGTPGQNTSAQTTASPSSGL
jgi:hypothetical protein